MFERFLLFLFLKNKNFLLNMKDNNNYKKYNSKYTLPEINHDLLKKNNFIKFKIY
jgi:hypothetical protein